MDKIYMLMPEKLGRINPDIYGVFAEHIGGVIYDGIWCTEDSGAENIRGFRKFIIDKIKEEKSVQKDLYDYQKSIAEKTKNISSLQKRIEGRIIVCAIERNNEIIIPRGNTKIKQNDVLIINQS